VGQSQYLDINNACRGVPLTLTGRRVNAGSTTPAPTPKCASPGAPFSCCSAALSRAEDAGARMGPVALGPRAGRDPAAAADTDTDTEDDPRRASSSCIRCRARELLELGLLGAPRGRRQGLLQLLPLLLRPRLRCLRRLPLPVRLPTANRTEGAPAATLRIWWAYSLPPWAPRTSIRQEGKSAGRQLRRAT